MIKSLYFISLLTACAFTISNCSQPQETPNSGTSNGPQKEATSPNGGMVASEESAASAEANVSTSEKAIIYTDGGQMVDIGSGGYIDGRAVIMRASYSTQSANIGSFKDQESVVVIKMFTPTNRNEGITKKYVPLYDQYGNKAETLNPGRAVKILGMEGDKFKVSYTSTNRSTYYATIGRSEIEIISGEPWYYVEKLSDGKKGWVFSKFLVVEENMGC
jgi:hypothetical protein